MLTTVKSEPDKGKIILCILRKLEWPSLAKACKWHEADGAGKQVDVVKEPNGTKEGCSQIRRGAPGWDQMEDKPKWRKTGDVRGRQL